jgi:hypothetical protein
MERDTIAQQADYILELSQRLVEAEARKEMASSIDKIADALAAAVDALRLRLAVHIGD